MRLNQNNANVPPAQSSKLTPLPHEPYDRGATVDIPLGSGSTKDLKALEKELQAKEAELKKKEQELKRREEAISKPESFLRRRIGHHFSR
ncbi:unnamed protein product [Rhodiola kirilowii]